MTSLVRFQDTVSFSFSSLIISLFEVSRYLTYCFLASSVSLIIRFAVYFVSRKRRNPEGFRHKKALCHPYVGITQIRLPVEARKPPLSLLNSKLPRYLISARLYIHGLNLSTTSEKTYLRVIFSYFPTDFLSFRLKSKPFSYLSFRKPARPDCSQSELQ